MKKEESESVYRDEWTATGFDGPFPADQSPVIVTLENNYGERFVDTDVFFNGNWSFWGKKCKIVAFMSTPEPYREKAN